MDTQFMMSEAEFEDQYNYSLGASSQPKASMGNSENVYLEGEEALDTLKLEYGIETKDGEGNNEEDAAQARSLALKRTRSLAFGAFNFNGQYKDSATDMLLTYHNDSLRDILAELLSEHRWKESAGVLSVLLKASVKDNHFYRHQHKYWAALEVLRQLEGFVPGNANAYKRIYFLLKSKQPDPKRAINKRLQPTVQLELAIHLMNQGDLKGARETSKLVLQEPQFRDDPVANLVRGSILHQLWYDGVTEGLNITENSVNTLSEDMEIDSSETSSTSYGPAANSHPFLSRESSRKENRTRLDPYSSIGKKKAFTKDWEHAFSRKQCSKGPVYNTRQHHVRGAVYNTGEHHFQGFNEDREECSSGDEGDISEAMTVNCSSGLDRRLFPIRLPRTSENRTYIIPTERSNVRELRLEALKHFRVALSSSSPLIAALLPYLQLLLSTGQVKEAWKTVEAFCRNSNHFLPFSLRARLAESLSSKQSLLLQRCYEEVLCKNPTSGRSIKGLVKLHKKGDYQTESLLEYIALHLDATYGCTYIWRELASCFLKMQAKCQSEYEMDCMSTEQNGNHSDAAYMTSISAIQLPNMFRIAESRRTWKLRCRWWARRHFSKDRIYLQQQENGDWEQMTFKAACACHMLGPKFGYVSDIICALQRVEKKNMLSVLESHIQCSLRLHEHLR